MTDRVYIAPDGRMYECGDCPYHERDIAFCGFCLQKILDEMSGTKESEPDGTGEIEP